MVCVGPGEGVITLLNLEGDAVEDPDEGYT